MLTLSFVGGLDFGFINSIMFYSVFYLVLSSLLFSFLLITLGFIFSFFSMWKATALLKIILMEVFIKIDFSQYCFCCSP